MTGLLKSENPSSGFFVVLYDEDTLKLYLDRGIYGFLMKPEYDKIGRYSRHYAALADYSCGRRGTHVFFFLKRRIHYGGQLMGSDKYGCFYLNGSLSPMGIKSDAKLCWNESTRGRYKATNRPGVFMVTTKDGLEERCQPYLIRFKDEIGLLGKNILSDDYYYELGKFGHPLPSNTIQGMSFCTLTPGECEILLELLQKSSSPRSSKSSEEIDLTEEPISYKPEYGISKLSEADNESHIEAALAANPDLLPHFMRPEKNAICRQVPVSPLKPYQMDRADICYYAIDQIESGTLPNTVIELKNDRAAGNEVNQVVRYVKWLKRVAPSDYKKIKLYLFAPDFSEAAKRSVPTEFKPQIDFVSFEEAASKHEQTNLG